MPVGLGLAAIATSVGGTSTIPARTAVSGMPVVSTMAWLTAASRLRFCSSVRPGPMVIEMFGTAVSSEVGRRSLPTNHRPGRASVTTFD